MEVVGNLDRTVFAEIKVIYQSEREVVETVEIDNSFFRCFAYLEEHRNKVAFGGDCEFREKGVGCVCVCVVD